MGQSASTPGDNNKVVLYQFMRGANVPSVSPYCLKLETYLRMAKVEHVSDYSGKEGPKKKIPWISFKGEPVADSQFCIEYLNKQFDIDLNKNLSKERVAISRSFLKMTEENFFWGMALYSIVYYKDEEYLLNDLFYNFPWYFKYFMPIFKRKVNNMAWAQGMGRHSKEEVAHIMELDLRALSDYLGDKQYFMGDEPTEIDAALFGQLAQLVWATEPKAPHKVYMEEKCRNIVNYCKRMKERYWPDWSDIVAKPQTSE